MPETQITMWRVSHVTLRSNASTGAAVEVEHVSELLTIDQAGNLLLKLSERPGVIHALIRRDLLVASGTRRNDPIPV